MRFSEGVKVVLSRWDKSPYQMRKSPELSLSLPSEDTARRGALASKEAGFHQEPNWPAL